MKSNTIIDDPYHIDKDQKMHFLSSAINKEEVEPLLHNLISDLLGKKIEIDIFQIKVLRYKPNKRCIIEYDIKISQNVNYTAKNGNNYFILKLLGKACSKSTDLRTFHLLQNLWENGFDTNSSDFISIPQPIGIISKFNMWFQPKIDSIPLIDKLLYDNKNESSRLISKISDAIIKLHKTTFLQNSRFHSLSDELSILDDRLSQTMEENSCWKSEIENVLDNCHKLSKLISSSNNIKNIHRDFYHDQVIVDNNSRIYLVDLDLCCKGDPTLDIGNFNAHLEEYSLRISGDTQMFSQLSNIFINRYLELSKNTSMFSVNAYTLLSLARHIWISTKFSDRKHTTSKLISICNSRIKFLINTRNNL
ncbi:MAG: phosphotransferase family protein [Nitrososphaeraceae archaeon]